MKFSELKKREPQHALVFGDPKSGKSLLAAKLAEVGFKLVWLSLDNGHTVIGEHVDKKYWDNFDIIVMPDTPEFAVGVTTCLKLFNGTPHEVCNTHGQVNCMDCRAKRPKEFTRYCFNELPLDHIVVLDHGTQLSRSAMNLIFSKQIKDGKTDYKPGYDEFRTQGNIMDRIFGSIQHAPYNVIVLAHTWETEMEDGKKKLVPSVGTGPYSRNVGGFFDHVIYCHVEIGKHNFGSSTIYKPMVITGSRSEVAIEKETVASLKLFFDGTIQAAREAEKHGAEVAKQILTSADGSTVGSSIVGSSKQPDGSSPQASTLAALAALKGK